MAKIKPATIPGTSTKVKIQRYATYFFRAVLILILIRGFVSFFDKDTIMIQEEKPPIVGTPAAMSFAEAFAEAYYTIERGQNEKHRTGITPFVGQGLLGDAAGMRLNEIPKSYRVLDTLAWSTDVHSPERADITVRTKIESSDGDVFYRYLAVPVAYNGSGFYVNDFPYVVPEPPRVNGEIASYPSRPGVSRDIEQDIRTATEDFFQSYASAPPSQLRYYMLDNREVHGYNGTMKFDGIKEVIVFDGRDSLENPDSSPTEEVLAYATVNWKDVEGFSQTQHFTIRFVFSNDRWLIKSIQGGFKP